MDNSWRVVMRMHATAVVGGWIDRADHRVVEMSSHGEPDLLTKVERSTGAENRWVCQIRV